LGVPVVATNDPICATAEEQPLADILTAIRRKSTIAGIGVHAQINGEQYLLSESQFLARYGAHPEAIKAAIEVAERCHFSLDSLRYRYPTCVVPAGQSAIGQLRDLVMRGMHSRYGVMLRSVLPSVEHELAVIEELDFASYFLTVHDIVSFARARGILCQGRGSAANSAVCYMLGITEVDPARSSLLFERFLSKERGEPPDIDVDFEHTRREEVIQYIYEKYGRDRAAILSEVITYRHRSAVRDVGKALGLTLDTVDRLARATSRWSAGEGTSWRELAYEVGVDPHDPSVMSTMRWAEKLVGTPRHASIHVGGFVITEGALIETVPVEPATMPNRTIVQWDKYDAEALGFVKIDILSLGILTAIQRTFGLVERFWNRSLTLANVPAECPEVYEMFCRAQTVGVFQIESRAQMSMLPRLKPRCYYDLVVEVALVRPGPIQGGMVHPYLRRRRKEEPVTYAHPKLEPILARTLGVPLFQEQVMQMAVAVGGFSAGEADQLRRAMGAWRKTGSLDGIGERFVAGMKKQGISASYADAIFRQIQGFAEYGFPESHAASFALLVYVSGWLKRHYPAAFTAALLNAQPMGFYPTRTLIDDVKRAGVQVLPVCIQRSLWDSDLERLGVAVVLSLGFHQVRGLAEEAVCRLLVAREEAAFISLIDVAERSGLGKGSLRLLATAGAFHVLESNRRRAAWVLEAYQPSPLFQGIGERVEPTTLPLETPMEGVVADYRAVGFSLKTHPIVLMREAGDQRPKVADLLSFKHGELVEVVGIVLNRQRPRSASGVTFLTIEDETGLLNLVVWPKVWSMYRSVARHCVGIGVAGELQRDGYALSVLVKRFWSLDLPASLAAPSRDFR
jgi:error-prone DNA polymerase